MIYDFLKGQYEDSVIKRLEEDLALPPNRAIVFDNKKIDKEYLKSLFPSLKEHPFCANALIDEESKLSLGKTILHDIGAFYILDPSALLVPYFLDLKPDDLVLDMCAAPGGKSIAASIKMQGKGLIVSNDVSLSRTLEMMKNVERLGISNIIITCDDLTKVQTKNIQFDKIILDAPCSGTGMFRKEKKMQDDFTINKVKRLLPLQDALLDKAYQLLKPGGTIIYSTCSFDYEEDEDRVLTFLSKHDDMHLVTIDEEYKFYHHENMKEAIHIFYEHHLGEGHFIAKLVKDGILKKEKPAKLVPFKMNDNIYLTDERIELVQRYFHIVRPNVLKEEKINKVYRLAHHYAKTSDELIRIPLSLEKTKQYLEGQTFPCLNIDGDIVFTYQNIPLGLAKIKKGKMQNLYPKGLRKKY